MAEFSPTRTHATWKPRVSSAHLPYYRCSECGAVLAGIDGNVEITCTNDGERSLLFEPPYGHVDFKPNCCGKPMERIELVNAADVEDRFKLTYQILGGMNNNCINVNWRSIDSTCKPRWFGLKTFTGMQHKYVTPKKWPPVVFALADEDAFAYCDKNPCVQCTFRCKREFEIYAYVENIGMVVKHLDEWVAPGSASTDDFDSPTEIMEKARKAKAEKKAAAAKIKKAQLDSIAVRRKEKTTAKLLLQKEREEARLAARRLKAASKLKARQARAARKGKVIPVDSAALRELDSLIEMNMAEQDSLLNLLADSLLSDTTAMALPADSVDSLALPRDSIYRLMKGYRDVRIFRSDFQTVCDSIVAISTDSTIHLYIDPVLWNQSNQITSDVMDIFTERQQIKRAEFIGSPMMASQLDTTHYNQVAGKTMTAYFYNNQIYRNDVNGNAQTIYYMQDGEPPEITMMGVIESGDCSFYIEDKQVVQITYRTEPVYNFYPMDDIPPTQDLYLKGFKWEGARRPVQADVFDRRIRPSQRKERTRLRHPDFPIMMRIEEHKKRLIEQRRWADRNDQVDPLTVEWMRELGYEVGQPREPQRPAPQAE